MQSLLLLPLQKRCQKRFIYSTYISIMTISAKPAQSFALHSTSCLSIDSLYSNESCPNTTGSSDCFSPISLPSEDYDEDWQEFGYLLDCKPIDDPNPHANYQLQGASESEFSSLDVEVASNDQNTKSFACCDKFFKREFSRDQDEPVAKRTRRARTDSLRQGLEKLREMPKEDVIYKFLRSSKSGEKERVGKCVKWHNVCRPWWHNKLLSSEEEGRQAIKKQRDSEDAMCDPRFISLGGTNELNKEVSFKMESGATNQELTIPSPATYHHGQFLEDGESLAIENTSTEPATESRRTKKNLQFKTDNEDQEGTIKKGGKRVSLHSAESQKKGASRVQSSAHIRKPTFKRQHRLQQQQQDNDADDENEASGRSDGDGMASKYCICGNVSGPSDSKKFYITCNKCKSYFHGKCVGLTEKKAQKLSVWTCAECEKQKSSTEELYCVCRQPYNDKKFYVGCDKCEDWFHPECINTTQQEISQFDEFICPKCRE